MRINNYGNIPQLYKLNQTKKMNAAYGAKAYSKDEVSISQTGKDFQTVYQALARTPDVRAEKVEELKSQIESGNYNVSTADFASKLLENYNAAALY
jgi:negative regulator of flagellin synthesis FlgM